MDGNTKYVSFGASGIDKSLSVVELTCVTDSWVLVDSTSSPVSQMDGVTPNVLFGTLDFGGKRNKCI